MGRQIKILNTDLSYIAGFLDGDGSVMIQIKKRKDSLKGWRLMFTVCFYQDTRHEKPLFWIQKKLNIGYISRRNDNMTELRINGYKQVKDVLEKLYPYVKFKKKQIEYTLQMFQILDSEKKISEMKRKDKKRLANAILRSRQQSYQSGLKKMEKLKSDLSKILEY